VEAAELSVAEVEEAANALLREVVEVEGVAARGRVYQQPSGLDTHRPVVQRLSNRVTGEARLSRFMAAQARSPLLFHGGPGSFASPAVGRPNHA